MTTPTDQLVGVTEAAARIGVAPATIHKWRTRHPDFPPPLVTLATGPIWDWTDIQTWVTGRANSKTGLRA